MGCSCSKSDTVYDDEHRKNPQVASPTALRKSIMKRKGGIATSKQAQNSSTSAVLPPTKTEPTVLLLATNPFKDATIIDPHVREPTGVFELCSQLHKVDGRFPALEECPCSPRSIAQDPVLLLHHAVRDGTTWSLKAVTAEDMAVLGDASDFDFGFADSTTPIHAMV